MTHNAIPTLDALEQKDIFIRRHIGPSQAETAEMLAELGVDSVEALIDETVPASIRLQAHLNIGEARTEEEVLAHLKAVASKNKVNTVSISFTATWLIKMVCGRMGVARRRLRMPPSR